MHSVRGNGARAFRVARYNLWVIGAIFVLAAVLGVLNNLRVYEEQRVELWRSE